MATNPRIGQEDRGRPRIVPRPVRMVPQPPALGTGAIIAGIMVAIALLAAIVYYMPRSSTRKTPVAAASHASMQPNNEQLQVNGTQMSLDPTGESLYLDGRLTNTGTRDISGAIVDIKLRGQRGNITEVVQRPMQGLSETPGAVNEFASRPIKPNETRFFRVAVSPIPLNWNHEIPELQVVLVSSHE